MLLVTLAQMERMHGLPDFIRQLYQNTAQESREVQTARAMLPVSWLASDDSVIPLHFKSGKSEGCLFSLVAHIPQHSSNFCASGGRIRQRCLVLLESQKSPPLPPHAWLSLHYLAATHQIRHWSHFVAGAGKLFPSDAFISKWLILYPQLIPKIKNPTNLDLSKSKAGILISSVAKSALVWHKREHGFLPADTTITAHLGGEFFYCCVLTQRST